MNVRYLLSNVILSLNDRALEALAATDTVVDLSSSSKEQSVELVHHPLLYSSNRLLKLLVDTEVLECVLVVAPQSQWTNLPRSGLELLLLLQDQAVG